MSHMSSKRYQNVEIKKGSFGDIVLVFEGPGPDQSNFFLIFQFDFKLCISGSNKFFSSGIWANLKRCQLIENRLNCQDLMKM